MFRKLCRNGFILNAVWFGPVVDFDNVSPDSKTAQSADISIVKNETGWDRIKRMFQTDEFGDLSPEVVMILNVGAMSTFVGAVYGGSLHSRTAYTDFIRNNQASKFNDPLEAKKKLQDKVTLSFGKGAFKWSWRLALFCSTFVGVSTIISTYRGKTGILEYVAAGSLAGFLYKFNMGPRAWVVGSGLGGALGLVAGCTTLGLLKLTGVSMDEVRYWQYAWRQERVNYVNKGMVKYLEKEEGELLIEHNKKLLGELENDVNKLDNLKTDKK